MPQNSIQKLIWDLRKLS